jgi:RimJ/RimL family protein N-acetyltransferase
VRLLRLSISPANAPSLAMAAKMGFRHAGEQVDEEDGLELILEVVRE